MNKRQKNKKQRMHEIVVMVFTEPKKNMGRIVNIISILGVVFTILAFFTSYFGKSYSNKPNADIQEQVMSVSYLSGLGNRQNKYPLFNDDVNNMKEYQYIDNCATQIIVTNDYNNEILLEKMIFEATDIAADNTPVLDIHLIPTSNSDVNIECVNHGWGDANNVTIELYGEGLDDFIVESKHSIVVPSISAGERIELPIWNAHDLIKDNCDKDLFLNANCVDINGNTIPIANENPIYIGIRDGEFTSAGGFGPSEEIYGIKIDTSNEKYTYEYNISECIKAKERIELPICFYPDKSCSLKFRVTFTVVYNNSNDRMNVSTDWAEVKFQISSIAPYGLNDASDYSSEQLSEMIQGSPPGFVKVTYPAVDRAEMEGIEPRSKR